MDKSYHCESLSIILITQGVSRVVEPMLNSGYKIVGIIESAPRKIGKRTLLRRCLKFIYRTITMKSTLKSIAVRKRIPYFYMDNGSNVEMEAWIKKLNPDLIVVYSMSQLLKKNIIDIPRYGAINLHPSWLPKFRGPFPDFWTYYYFDLNPGVTVHYIDEGEDTGDIIYREKYRLPLGMKSPDMLDLAIGKIGCELLMRAINDIHTGNIPRIPQPKESPVPRARRLKREEHDKIIDWNNWEIERVWHLLRGTEQWLNAFEQPGGLFRGQRWSIEGYEKCQTNPDEIGRVIKKRKENYLVCKDGIIHLKRTFSLKQFVLNLLED